MSVNTIFSIIFEFNIFLISFIISYIIYNIIRFYQNVRTYPPGPLPLPLIGNILHFLSKDNWDVVFKRCARSYGPIFTIWLGPKPMVIISDLDIGRDLFSKIEFSGRHQNFLGDLYSNDIHKDVIFGSGEAWEVLRKVTYSAVQKYATNEKLCLLTSDCVEKKVDEIISREGVEQEFSSYEYINSLVINIMANSVYGEGYGANDVFFKFIEIFLQGGLKYRMILWISSPLIRFLDFRAVSKLENAFDDIFNFARTIYKNHYKDYDESIERDFCDALITAKNEALREGKQSLKHLTDDNLSMVTFDLFIGTATTTDSLQWILLFISYYPEFQQKLRQEIENQIGDRIPTHEDRNRCHFVMAFISEALRLRNVVPGSVPHAATLDCKIGNYSIPKGTGIMVFQDMILTDEKYWPNAHEFSPQRFLENGVFISRRPKAYIPFGVGRRVCVAEKLAMADIFLIIVRFIQLTNEYEIVLGSNGGLNPEQNFHLERPPAQFNIILRKRLMF